MSFWRHLFGKDFLKRLAIEWAESYLQDQVGQVLQYLQKCGWVDETGLNVPADKLPDFGKDLVKAVLHALQHG